jgi:hypothetical protein
VNNFIEVPLVGKYASNRYAIVDADDYIRIAPHNWHVDERDYVYTFIKANRVYLHRLIMRVSECSILIDHANHNKLDNRKSNLRKCSNSQNQANTKSWGGRKTKGVYRHRTKWVARISFNGDRIYLGRFDSMDEALNAYNKKSKELFKEFSYTG